MTANSCRPARPAKGKRVETLWQAQTFDFNKKHYLKLGLCYPCAAQAAWGHQLGFSESKPPCRKCQPIVETFPTRKQNGWRSHSPRHGAEWPPEFPPGAGYERV